MRLPGLPRRRGGSPAPSFEAVADGWSNALWQPGRVRALAADAASSRITSSSRFPAEPESEDRFARSLGIPAAVLSGGQGLAFTGRLAAEWSRDERKLDRRLRRQFVHLIDGSVEVTPSLCRHLVALAASSYPLVEHRVAVATKNLVLHRLATDEAGFLSAWEMYLAKEPAMWQTHAGFFRVYGDLETSAGDEQQLESVANAYQAIMEGDVRRTAIAVLAFAGNPPPRDATLTPLKEALQARGTLLCTSVASAINTRWRNAIAHREMWWDASRGIGILADEPVHLVDLLTAAEQARAVCRGVDHGVEVAFGIAQPAVGDWLSTASGSSRDLAVLDVLGGRGIFVYGLRRAGAQVDIAVREISAENWPGLLAALVRASELDPEVSRWHVSQPDRDQPPLCIDRSWIEAVQRSAGSSGLRAPEDLFPLLMNGLLNSGVPARSAARCIISIGAVQVAGEADRIHARLYSGETAAYDEQIDCVQHVRSALKLSGELAADPSAERLLSRFDQMLAVLLASPISPPQEFFRRVEAIRQVLAARGVQLPWISPTLRGVGGVAGASEGGM